MGCSPPKGPLLTPPSGAQAPARARGKHSVSAPALSACPKAAPNLGWSQASLTRRAEVGALLPKLALISVVTKHPGNELGPQTLAKEEKEEWRYVPFFPYTPNTFAN